MQRNAIMPLKTEVSWMVSAVHHDNILCFKHESQLNSCNHFQGSQEKHNTMQDQLWKLRDHSEWCCVCLRQNPLLGVPTAAWSQPLILKVMGRRNVNYIIMQYCGKWDISGKPIQDTIQYSVLKPHICFQILQGQAQPLNWLCFS